MTPEELQKLADATTGLRYENFWDSYYIVRDIAWDNFLYRNLKKDFTRARYAVVEQHNIEAACFMLQDIVRKMVQ